MAALRDAYANLMSDPQLVIQHSDDGGHTWSAEMWYTLGPEGDYGRRVELFCQGAARQRVYRLRFTDNRSFTIISAHADISFGI